MIIGMLWNRNEGDILEEIITNALPHVDSLFLADDHSTDNSWEIMKSFEKNPKVEYMRNTRDDARDKGQRQSLLNEIRRRYRPEDNLVQIIESDIMILDTDIKKVWEDWNINDVGMCWHLLNAARKPGTWAEIDTYPKWNGSIKELMPYGHRVETMVYTFRPFSGLFYDFNTWSPWPHGFEKYLGGKPLFNKRKGLFSPLLAHYGFRGPTHVFQKYKGKKFAKYPEWDMSTKESVEKTFYYFNGVWNNEILFKMSRDGWIGHRKS